MAEQVWAIVVAGGDARRFGRPKQFELLAGRPVLQWSVDAARTVAEEVILVLPAAALADRNSHGGCTHVVAGGATRSASVRAGLAAVPASATIVVVHDAARPLASSQLFARVLGALVSGVDAVIPGLPLADTVKRVAGGTVLETIPREDLVAVQTPQVFRAAALRAAHRAGGDATDDAALIEAIGGTVAVVDGEATNMKITDTIDLARLEVAAAHLATQRR